MIELMYIMNIQTNQTNKTNYFLIEVNKSNNHVCRYFYQNIDYVNMYDDVFELHQKFHKMDNILYNTNNQIFALFMRNSYHSIPTMMTNDQEYLNQYIQGYISSIV